MTHNKNTYILGISSQYHDSAASILLNGDIIAAAEEERFTRKKHDGSFPVNSIKYCLEEAKISLQEVDFIVFHEKPLLRFNRKIQTILSYAPRGFDFYMKTMPSWINQRLYPKKLLLKELEHAFNIPRAKLPKLLFNSHHYSHAASAFFPSPFKKAGILCVDGAGEWSTTSTWKGDGNKIELQWQLDFPHSLGYLYSAFTYFCGFKVDSGEYKLMGLAPYGEPKYVSIILENLIDIKEDGTFKLNMDFFAYPYDFQIITNKFSQLFKLPPRNPEGNISQDYMDIARSIQFVCEEIILKLAHTMYKEVNSEYLCLSGGVALNCVANGKIIKKLPFKEIWIQPAAGDSGNSIGAALTCWYNFLGNNRYTNNIDTMKGSLLGPSYSDSFISHSIAKYNAVYTRYNEDELYKVVAEKIKDGCVVGWFQGRMEFGPRALGNRSILGDPRNESMQSKMNIKIKFRESFRPFAPAILEEKASEIFDLNQKSPYMLLVADILDKYKISNNDTISAEGLEKLKIIKSKFPAITHVDYSSRIQTVSKLTNEKFYKLIKEFEALTGCPILINTSFNIRGEPIVCCPDEAYACFMRTDMDILVMGNMVFDKKSQPTWHSKDIILELD